MLILISSPDTVAPNGCPKLDLVHAMIDIADNENPVGIISNHGEPAWFNDVFKDSGVQFLRVPGRQDGKILFHNAKKFQLEPYDVLVLAAKAEDVQMGKNGGAVLVAAGWSDVTAVQGLGIRIDNATELQMVVKLTSSWAGNWWFSGDGTNYNVRALADLSGYGKGLTQQAFATKITETVKQGGGRLKALLAITARSLLVDGIGEESNLIWGTYPSSNSTNNDQEVLSDFTHRLRTTVSRVRLARREDPLFIRHKSSPKRSYGAGGDRTDPANQIETLHLNPSYKKNIKGKHVVVVDDCTTYGVSFGVAAAFLRKAGAKAVTGVALGKFGEQLRYYEIEINSDPFSPIGTKGYKMTTAKHFAGTKSSTAQNTLLPLIP